jgi:ceramide glucosyltransferase
VLAILRFSGNRIASSHCQTSNPTDIRQNNPNANVNSIAPVIAQNGARIAISPVVVECWEAPVTWIQVWKHQLRWARTIRVCQPGPYFMSIISNCTLWAVLFLASNPLLTWPLAAGAVAVRAVLGYSIESKMTGRGSFSSVWMGPVSDLLKALIWLLSFLGNEVIWRGKRFRVLKGGKMVLRERD